MDNEIKFICVSKITPDGSEVNELEIGKIYIGHKTDIKSIYPGHFVVDIDGFRYTDCLFAILAEWREKRINEILT